MSSPVPPPPKPDPSVEPDNWHVTDEPAAAPDGLLTEGKSAKPAKVAKPVKGGTVKPDNWHVTDEPA